MRNPLSGLKKREPSLIIAPHPIFTQKNLLYHTAHQQISSRFYKKDSPPINKTKPYKK
ncbi:hypothetical protein HMPREF1432_00319 [Helicobacter pylori GAMchJs114i]|nr:hypothetical protein HMPREF1432_00319 [Helicobacter pylori GAMchJs114i]